MPCSISKKHFTVLFISCIRFILFYTCLYYVRRSRWLRGLRRRSASAWLLVSGVWIPLRAWMFVSCVHMLCCVGTGLCDGLISRPAESYRVSISVWLRNLNTEEDKAQVWAVVPWEKKVPLFMTLLWFSWSWSKTNIHDQFASNLLKDTHKEKAWWPRETETRCSYNSLK
jgi:hypothetical protein